MKWGNVSKVILLRILRVSRKGVFELNIVNNFTLRIWLRVVMFVLCVNMNREKRLKIYGLNSLIVFIFVSGEKGRGF